MTTSMDPTFASGLQDVLVRYIETTPRRRRRARWRWGIGTLLVTGVLGGGTAAAAQLVLPPGSEAHADLGTPVTVTRTGTATIDLGARPPGASQVWIALKAFDTGTYDLGRGGAAVTIPPQGRLPTPGPSGSARGARWSRNDTTGSLSLSQLNPDGRSITIATSSPQLHWTATFTWIRPYTVPWEKNASGQTYGALNADGSPVLIAVQATNGREGYVYRDALAAADGSAAAQQFTSPGQALTWQKAHAGKTTFIPVYESDGKTRIGEFEVGP